MSTSNTNRAFIPTRLKVGFQKRSDSIQSNLGYVIYFDEKGVLRKNTSWENWRDKSIEPVDLDNVPTAGFLVNKNITRNGYGWHSTITKIRVYDPRGFEIEVNVGNFIGIVDHSVIDNGEIKQECVYVWFDKELFLIPTNSEVYQKAMANTAKQSSKVDKKTMVVGGIYSVKKDSNPAVYLGNIPFQEIKHDYYNLGNGKRCTDREFRANKDGYGVSRLRYQIQGLQRDILTASPDREIQIQEEIIRLKQELAQAENTVIDYVGKISCEKKHLFHQNGEFVALKIENLATFDGEVNQEEFADIQQKFAESTYSSPIVAIERYPVEMKDIISSTSTYLSLRELMFENEHGIAQAEDTLYFNNNKQTFRKENIKFYQKSEQEQRVFVTKNGFSYVTYGNERGTSALNLTWDEMFAKPFFIYVYRNENGYLNAIDSDLQYLVKKD